MRHISTLFLAAGVLTVPLSGVARAQEAPDSGRSRPEWGGRQVRFDLVGRLLAKRADLNLTDDQVTQLTAIRQKYAEQNRPLIERLRSARSDSAFRGDSTRRESLRRMTKEERSAMRDEMRARRKAWADAHPDLVQDRRQLRTNARAMRDEVRATLTAEQRTRIEQSMKEHRHGRRHRSPGTDGRSG